jgi:hypothetical protein
MRPAARPSEEQQASRDFFSLHPALHSFDRQDEGE